MTAEDTTNDPDPPAPTASDNAEAAPPERREIPTGRSQGVTGSGGRVRPPRRR